MRFLFPFLFSSSRRWKEVSWDALPQNEEGPHYFLLESLLTTELDDLYKFYVLVFLMSNRRRERRLII